MEDDCRTLDWMVAVRTEDDWDMELDGGGEEGR